jgi:hypothetical protein
MDHHHLLFFFFYVDRLGSLACSHSELILATHTGQYEHKINADIHSCLKWD